MNVQVDLGVPHSTVDLLLAQRLQVRCLAFPNFDVAEIDQQPTATRKSGYYHVSISYIRVLMLSIQMARVLSDCKSLTIDRYFKRKYFTLLNFSLFR